MDQLADELPVNGLTLPQNVEASGGIAHAPPRGRGGFLAVGLVAVGLSVAGCSGGNSGGPSPTPTPPAAIVERSLFWTDPALLDDPAVTGLSRAVGAFAGATTDGAFVDAWFRRFATTPHSSRYGPQLLLEDFALTNGADPAAWDIDQLPFIATAVHNRIDLMAQPAEDGSTPGNCGQLRISYASTHPTHSPFHLIFLFVQPLAPGDADADGFVHCRATARRWAELSAMTPADFVAAARVIAAEGFVAERRILAESLEQTVSPWEWRQWTFDAAPENPPLFQSVDSERLNLAGPDRDAFLAWAEQNAYALNARRLLVPPEWRAPSERVPASVARVPLDLTGVDPGVLIRLPALRQNIEIVGCPVCHTADAEFVQTRPDRTPSPFYEKELDARAVQLDAINAGTALPPPFGPIQPDPILPE